MSKTTKSMYIASRNTERAIKGCIEASEPVLLIGETGVGKTTIIREMAKESGKELIRVSLNGTTGVDEILGKWLAKNGSTVWQDGILTTAMRNGHWIVFDEINAALPEVLFTLHSLLDDDRKVVLAEKDGEIVRPTEEFRFFGTMNPTEDYAGTKDLNKALLSRFAAVIEIPHLEEVDEIRVLTEIHGVEEPYAMQLVQLASTLREKKKKDEIFYFCSTRDLVYAGKLCGKGLQMNEAIGVSILGKMSRPEVEVMKEELAKFFSAPAPTVSLAQIIADFEKVKKERDEYANQNMSLQLTIDNMNKNILEKITKAMAAVK